MGDALRTLETPHLIAALEANLEEEMLCFGRGLAGAEIYHDGEIEGFLTGRPHLNGILRVHLQETTPIFVTRKIQAVVHYFRQRPITSMGWSLGQDCQPAQMEHYLLEQGFRHTGEENRGMALDIAALSAEAEAVEGLCVHEVANLEDLSVLRRLEIEGFGSSEEMAQNYYEMYSGVGFGKGTVWRHFLGWWQGQAVSMTSLLFHAGVAGLYGVATLPQARRHGIARALVLHAIEVARQEGYHVVVLSPTNMSERIYSRLGFRDYTRIRHYSCAL